MAWKIETTEVNNIKVIKIVLDGLLAPEQLSSLVQAVSEAAGGARTVVISGRLPVWAFSAITAALMTQCRTVAVADPKLGGAVVVAGEEAIGSVIQLPPEAF